jgi:uncharacterized protein YodC (DUF2158 family)
MRIKVGDVVRRKSDGQVMTVSILDPATPKILCKFFMYGEVHTFLLDIREVEKMSGNIADPFK